MTCATQKPSSVWICPSGDRVYSVDEKNSTEELQYIPISVANKLQEALEYIISDINDGHKISKKHESYVHAVNCFYNYRIFKQGQTNE